MKPMLAVAAPEAIKFPVYASPKIDGVRALIDGGLVLSRKLLAIPNHFVQDVLGKHELNGLDGELTVGPANDPNVMQATMSGVMSRDGEPDFIFWVFDFWTNQSMPYGERYRIMERAQKDGALSGLLRVTLLPQALVNDLHELNAYEAYCLSAGYEGVMIRDPLGTYKYGRSTAREGKLLKVKRFVDSEAVVTGFKERMHNGNEAQVDELGHTKRSTHQENLTGMDTLGALQVTDVTTGIEFDVGTGFDDQQRAVIWGSRNYYLGKTLTYKHFANAGVKEKPRFPVFKSWRDERDI